MNRIALGAALATLAASCTCNPLAVDSVKYQCTKDDDCGPAYVCVSLICVSSAVRDGGGTSSDGGLIIVDGSDAGCLSASREICDNGVDDTCDHVTDCADPVCGGQSCGINGRFCTPDGGVCACSGNGGVAENVETNCVDGFDNDCNGKPDCFDPACAGLACDTAAPLTCQGLKCVCAPDAGTKVSPESDCANRKDDNCNGLVDCEETSCSGQACSAFGGTCVGVACACTSPGGVVEAVEATCDDTKDNDCDGLIDCKDSSCAGRACGAAGLVCVGAACKCGGNGGGFEQNEKTCGDGHDNDCDTLVDCNDADCDQKSCSLTGKSCQGGTCVCTVAGGVVQATETLCSDSKDNDCNGKSDCGDPSCDGLACGGVGKICVANACVCQVAGGGAVEVTEVSCSDGKDNDCDGLSDCFDPDCDTKLCGANGLRCSAAKCMCTGGKVGGTSEVTETSCGDGHDNDCNGSTDCDDSACTSQKCGTAKTCCGLSRGCVDTSSNKDCGGCGLACATSRACVLVNAVKAGYECSCSNTSPTCPSGTGSAQSCDGSFCTCTPSMNLASSQCAPAQVCDPGGFCSVKE